MDPWHTSRPDVSQDRGTGMSVPQDDTVSQDGRTPSDQETTKLSPVDVNSLSGQKILKAVHGSYIDTSYRQRWVVENIFFIKNEHLHQEYREKLQEMKQRTQNTGMRLRESLMFCCLASDKALQEIADKGYRIQPTGSSYLGDSMKGVTLSPCADVQLKVAELVLTDTCWMVMYRVIVGNCRLIADTEVQEEKVAVSPEYDSHRFATGPSTSQSIGEQAMRNQVFIFEFVSAGVTSYRPRQVLPIYALKLRKSPKQTCELEPAAAAPELTPIASMRRVSAQLLQDHATQQNMQALGTVQSRVPSVWTNLPVTQAGLQNMPAAQASCTQYAVLNQLANNSGLQNQQNQNVHTMPTARTILPATQAGSQNMSAVQSSCLYTTMNPIMNDSSLQNHQNPVVMQGERILPTAREVLQNQQNSPVVQPAYSAAPILLPQGSGFMSGPLPSQLSGQSPSNWQINPSPCQTPQVTCGVVSMAQYYGQTPILQNLLQQQQVAQNTQIVAQPKKGRTQIKTTKRYPVAAPVNQVIELGQSNTDSPVTFQPCGSLSTPVVELACNRDVSQTNPPSTLRSVCVTNWGGSTVRNSVSDIGGQQAAPPEAMSPVGLGMRLPTMIPPTESETVVPPPGAIQPIVIQPMSDVMPSFLRATPPDIQPDSANISCDVETLPVVSCMHIETQNPMLWNLIADSEVEQVTGLSASVVTSVSTPLLTSRSVSSKPLTIKMSPKKSVSSTSNEDMTQVMGTSTSMLTSLSVPSTPVSTSLSIQSMPVSTPTPVTLIVSVPSTPVSTSQLVHSTPVSTSQLVPSMPVSMSLSVPSTPVTLIVSVPSTPVSMSLSVPSTPVTTSQLVHSMPVLTSLSIPTTPVSTSPCVRSEPVMIKTSPKQSVSSATLVQDTETAQDTETTDFPGAIIGSASEIIPDGNTHTDMKQSSDEVLDAHLEGVAVIADSDSTDDRLGSVHCDIDSGMEVFPAPEGEGTRDVAAQDRGIENKSKDVSRIYVHDDGTLELIIEQHMTSASDEGDGSCTGSDSVSCVHEPCSDKANWKRFLTDKRFQPVVMLDRLSSVPRRPASTTHSAVEVAEVKKTGGEMCRTTETQKETTDCAEDAVWHSSANGAQTASASKCLVPMNKCLGAARSTEKTADDACNAERLDQMCSTAAQDNTEACPSGTKRTDLTHSTVTRNKTRHCHSDRSDESSVNPSRRVACRPVMKASVKLNKPSDIPQNLCLQSESRPCDRPMNRKVHAASGGACKRPHKNHVSGESEKSGFLEEMVAKKQQRQSHNSKSKGVVATMHKSQTGKHDANKRHKKHHRKHKHSEDSSQKRFKKSDSGREQKKRRTELVETVRWKNSSQAVKEANSTPFMTTIITESQQRPFSPKSQAQKISPIAKPWRPQPRKWLPGEMPPMLKTMAAKLKHGRSHNMLATWQQSGKAKTVIGPATSKSGSTSSKSHGKTLSLSEKGGCVKLVEKHHNKTSGDKTKKKPGEKIHCRKLVAEARRNRDSVPTLHTGVKQQNVHCSTLVDSGRRHSVGSNITNKTASDKHRQTVGFNHCSDLPKSSWPWCDPESGSDGKSTPSDLGQEPGTVGRTHGISDRCPKEISHIRGCTVKCSDDMQSPVLSTDSDLSASVLSPLIPSRDRATSGWSIKPRETRTVHKTRSQELLASVLTEAWHRPTSHHAVGSSAESLQSKAQPKQTVSAGSELMGQSSVERDVRSRHGSGQRDLPKVCSQTSHSGVDAPGKVDTKHDILWVLTELTIDKQAAITTYRQRQQQDLSVGNKPQQQDLSVGNKPQQQDLSVGNKPQQQDLSVGNKPQQQDLSVGNYKTCLMPDPRLYIIICHSSDDGHSVQQSESMILSDTVDTQTITVDVSTMSPQTVTATSPYVEVGMLEMSHNDKELSDGEWGDLVPVNLPQDVWNSSDFCVANSTVRKIIKEYGCEPPQERHQVMLVYSAKLKKMLKQIDNDKMFADETSANISSTSSCLNTSSAHNPVHLKKQLERQNLYKILADINASVIADKVKIASMPHQDKEIHRRIDRSRLDCEIINERLGQLNRFHMDKQIHVLPKIFRLCSELEKYLSVEGQFLFLRVRPIQLGHCNELYALKVIIENVYEELALVSERGAPSSRKHWLLLALGWLHMHRRMKLNEICQLDVQHVCELADLFHQRRAWYRKMQAELQKSPRQGSTVCLLDNPLKYLVQRIVGVTKYLEFIHQLQTLSNCAHRPADLDGSKDGFSACSNNEPAALPLQSTTKPLGVTMSVQGKAAQVSLKPTPVSSTGNSRYNIVRSVCLAKVEAHSEPDCCSGDAFDEDGCYDTVDDSAVCHNEMIDHGEENELDERVNDVVGDHGITEDFGQENKEDVVHNENDMPRGSESESHRKTIGDDIIESDMSAEHDRREESGATAACSDSHAKGNDEDIIDAESEMPKGSGYSEESNDVAACNESHAKGNDDDIVDAESDRSKGCGHSEGSGDISACNESHTKGNDDYIIDTESDMAKGSGHSEESNDVAACNESHAKGNNDEIVDTESEVPKGSGYVEECGDIAVCSESRAKGNGDDIVDTESDMPKRCAHSEESNDVAESQGTENDNEVIDTENDMLVESGHGEGSVVVRAYLSKGSSRREENDVMATCESQGAENGNDVIDTESRMSLETDHSEGIAAVTAVSSDSYATGNDDDDIIHTGSDMSLESDHDEESNIVAVSCKSYRKENDDDVMDAESNMSKENGHREKTDVTVACSDSYSTENDDSIVDMRSDMSVDSDEGAENDLIAVFCESHGKENYDDVVSAESETPKGHDDSEKQNQGNVDKISDTESTSGHSQNQDIENVAETSSYVGESDVKDTKKYSFEMDDGKNLESKDVTDVKYDIPEASDFAEDSLSDVRMFSESESGLNDSGHSIYEPISDVEELEEGDVGCAGSNANFTEQFYRVDKSDSVVRHAEDGNNGEVGHKRRNNTKHKVGCATLSCGAGVKPIGILMNMKEMHRSPEGKAIGVIVNRSVSCPRPVPVYRGRPCIQPRQGLAEEPEGSKRKQTAKCSAVPCEPPIQATAIVDERVLLAKQEKRRKHHRRKIEREMRLWTEDLAAANDKPAVMEGGVSDRTDNGFVGQPGDRHPPRFPGRSWGHGETHLDKSRYRHDAVTDPVYYTNCSGKGLPHDRVTVKEQRVDMPWFTEPASRTHGTKRYRMSADLHHEARTWFDYERGVHREQEGWEGEDKVRRLQRRERKQKKTRWDQEPGHRHTRRHHSWPQPQ
ncbi:hypothetical protein LSAT2_029884 [Lamellibrachia satsuma]|nr:hypothetical protein LSAT2_029884 [Lamellibrachia satsuma]